MSNILYTDLEVIPPYPKTRGEFSSPHCCEELSLSTPYHTCSSRGFGQTGSQWNAKLTERSEPSSEHCLDLRWYIPPLPSFYKNQIQKKMADFHLCPHSFLKIYLFAYYLFVCMQKSQPLPLSICGSCVFRCPRRPDKGMGIPGTMVTSSCDPPCESWELQEQEVHENHWVISLAPVSTIL